MPPDRDHAKKIIKVNPKIEILFNKIKPAVPQRVTVKNQMRITIISLLKQLQQGYQLLLQSHFEVSYFLEP